MKKFTSLGVAIFAALLMVGITSQANAVTLGVYDKGLLVPVTTHGTPGTDTAVGILCSVDTTVYWTFFDKQSNPIVDSEFPCTANDLYHYSLNNEAPNTEDVEGYIVFTANGGMTAKTGKTAILQADNATISGNAFLIDTNKDDAIFLPVVPLCIADYTAGTDLSAMTNTSIISLHYGFTRGDDCNIDVRYWLDPAYGACTNVILWTSECLNSFWQWGGLNPVPGNCYFDTDPNNPTPWILKCHLNVYDDEEHRTSVSIPLQCEVHNFYPSNITGWPNYIDGFIRIPSEDLMPTQGDGAFGFSYVTSTTFRAAQSLLASENCGTMDCGQAPVAEQPPCGCGQ